ncbi:hypothetical protein [Marinibacterium sp. SX1]|uniref:hypothetical protein n=1 Tax=Marinibacterium sp. SX1 TaxID=3388424 RepID=UPI003D1751F1
MKRDIHPDTLAAIVSGNFHPALMVYLDWPGDPVWAHTGAGDMSWGGQDWVGVASMGGIEIPPETADGVSSETILTLVVPEEDLDAIMAADIRNRPGEIYFAVVTERAGNVLIGEPFLFYEGPMNGLAERIERDGSAVYFSVRVTVGSAPGLRDAATVVHSYEHQQGEFPGDTAGRLLINSPAAAAQVVW